MIDSKKFSMMVILTAVVFVSCSFAAVSAPAAAVLEKMPTANAKIEQELNAKLVITGPDTIIKWPAYSEQVDYEIELAVIIGKTAKCVSPENAMDYIAGYTIANDISARSVTFKAERADRPWDEFFDWLNGKWFDSFLPIGPWLVTKDEIEDPQNLDMELTVNGKTRQKANTSQMIFTIARIVSFLSYIMTLEPGDCIATGTPEGIGPMNPGDTIEIKINAIGTLRNYVVKR